MKHTLLLLAAVSGMMLSAGTGKFPEHPSFLQIRNASLTPEKAKSIKTARIIYYVVGEKGETGVFMVRAKRPDQIRLDLFDGKEIYTSVRDKDKFWFYEPEKGISDMSKEDIASFEQFVALLPVPFNEKKIFTDPVFLKTETIKKEERSLFRVESIGMGTEKGIYTMSVDNQTKLLKRMKIADENDKTGFYFVYRNHEKVHDVEMAGNILIVYANENVKLSLAAADWNLNVSDDIFRRKRDVKDPETIALMKYQEVKKDEKKEKELQTAARISIATTERQIRNLKLEIQELEERLGKMENVMSSNRNGIASAVANESNGFWYKLCSHRRRHRGGRSSGRARVSRRSLRVMEKENRSVENDYLHMRNMLLKKRMELADLEVLLKQMKGK